MRNYLPVLFLFLIPLLSFYNSFQNGLDKVNLNYLYNPDAELRLKHRVIYIQDSAIVNLRLQLRSDLYELKDYIVKKYNVGNYHEKLGIDSDTLNLEDLLIVKKGPFFYFRIKLITTSKILALHIYNRHNQKNFFYDIIIEPKHKYGNKDIWLSDMEDILIMDAYLNKTDSFTITSLSRDFVYGYHYRRDFEIAEPPMITNPGKVNPNLTIDSTFILKTGKPYLLSDPGLYFFQTDSSTIYGLGMRVVEDAYPRLTNINDVISSLRYFSTRSEWALLNKAEEKKKALDNYWLRIAKSPEKAKRIIRSYYHRIQDANYFFSNYKEGWKTDRGMIFVVYGLPDIVNRTDEGEIWTYEKNTEFPRMKFSFAGVPNIFSNEHNLLIRDKLFQNDWFKAVDFWRKGKFNEINSEQ